MVDAGYACFFIAKIARQLNERKNMTAKKETKKSTTVADAVNVSKTEDSIAIKNKIVAKTEFTFKDIDYHDFVEVYNLTPNPLIYVNYKTGEETRWDHFGDMAVFEVQELLHMRNTQKSFFTNPWIRINDERILKFLKVEKYYENVPTCDNLDDLFDLSVDELIERINDFTDSTKRLVAYRASELINAGLLDSMKMIEKLEKALGFELIER